MIPNFNEAERAVHYPADRKLHVALKPHIILILLLLLVFTVGIAWLQYLLFGLPTVIPNAPLLLNDPSGFPMWLRIGHWVNFFFLILIIRSGISILMDHPRLYWNNGCKPETAWIRLTPLNKPTQKYWTAKDDARYISPAIALPGYKHTIGISRSWHFLTVPFFLLNGVIFVILLFYTEQWKRLVPVSLDIFPNAWNVFVHYATFNMPPEPNGFYQYNALQQLIYFAVIFILAPLAMLTGMAMSPAIENRFQWYPKIFGGRQGARSIHFLVMISYVIFIIIHVLLVILTGFSRNMNHIIMGTDVVNNYTGLYIGLTIILLVVAFCFYANWASWYKQRTLQKLQADLNETLWRYTINRFKPRSKFKKKDISPYFWLNGVMPVSDEWETHLANNFANYKLKISGLVDNPMELSVDEMKNIAKEQNITMHHCVQGWSGIAEWGGIPLSKIIELVKPQAGVTTVAFYSFGEGMYGGTFYETHTLDNCLKPESILAWEMNYEPLPVEHGAPLRLRVENQLGYKQVKWIKSIEFVNTHKDVGKGFGGKDEDDEYFDLLAST
jgi:sulfoxide reductase catalytic subunit YedY